MAIQPETEPDTDITLSDLRKQLDHIDEMLHEILRFLVDIQPLADRGKAMLDPGATIRAAWPRRRHAREQQQPAAGN